MLDQREPHNSAHDYSYWCDYWNWPHVGLWNGERNIPPKGDLYVTVCFPQSCLWQLLIACSGLDLGHKMYEEGYAAGRSILSMMSEDLRDIGPDLTLLRGRRRLE